MSVLLFAFDVEILAIQIRIIHEIHGIKFNENIDREYKIVRHADDCTNTKFLEKCFRNHTAVQKSSWFQFKSKKTNKKQQSVL